MFYCAGILQAIPDDEIIANFDVMSKERAWEARPCTLAKRISQITQI
jgi:hypothetical protein